MEPKKTVIIYRDELLGASETFIRAQAESLDRFQAFYLGLRRIPGLILPSSRSHIVSGNGPLGKVQRARFKLFGPSAPLRRKLAGTRPVLIHAHFGPDACNAILLASSLCVPLIATFHGYDITVSNDNMPYLYARRQNLLKKAGARFLCVSEFIRDRVVARGFPAAKTIVHYTGIDTDFFSPQPEIIRSPIVLFVGRLVAKKGCEYLVRAMALVQEKMPQVELIIIGDGQLRSQLERQAKAALTKCQFLGVQEPATVRKWMNRALVFCVPSVTAASGDAEGFGMVFAEAQSMGLPVVSCASGGIAEAVAHNQTGFLVPERDSNALAESISLLLSNRHLWTGFSQAGQARMKILFDIRKQAVSLQNIYEITVAKQNESLVDSQMGETNEREQDHVPAVAVPLQ
jgi:glycosyltransferase involved in cell wall biosynthesis